MGRKAQMARVTNCLPEVEETMEVKKGTARVHTVISDSKLPAALSCLINRTLSWYQLRKSVAWFLRFKIY